ncbi:YjgP/YjgQ family permease [Segetibacter sp. 3557_3]|uniref:LptF/LptG family permease n=1 Tax=Segetibacter sp. 3557_3 TaxID=2547429 RepID=UPI0010586CA4|nr:LptF/LptG family permease [Segetibacter sp. 3557_3]TDH25664.1 YjgP/YjgQ family permease [Segetibacter sp. 3557_3]
MKKIDGYILKNFLVTFFFSIFLFAFITIIIDVSEKTDDFVKSGLTFKEIITKYYYGFIPHILAMLFPLFVFIAVIFCTSKMAGRSEVVAILASGTSYNRFIRPFFMGAVLLATILWFANRYVIPIANEIRVSFQSKYIDGNNSYNPLLGGRNNLYLKIDSFTYAGVNYYDTSTRTGSSFFLQHVKGNQLDYNLRAESFRWDTAKRKWVLDNVIERRIDGLRESITMVPSKTMNFDFKPLDLKRDEYTKDKLITPELDEFIKGEEQRGVEGLNALKVERYRRDATPFSLLLLTLIGVTVASRRVRGGSGVHLATGFITAALFILTDRFSTIFSTKGNLSPLLAAWLPNIMFTFVAFWFYKRAPK